MNSDEFVACVGKPETAPEVQALLAAIGFKKALKIARDDDDVRVDMLKLGVTLIFEPEGPKSSRLVMTGVQFFSDAEEDYKTFQGSLPGQVLFSDSQAEVHAKLGKPSFSKKALRYDGWKSAGRLLTVEYAKKDQRVSMVSVELPSQD